MPIPNPNTYGIVENPLIISSFFDNDDQGGNFPPHQSLFLELAGPPIQLLDNTFFLLLGT